MNIIAKSRTDYAAQLIERCAVYEHLENPYDLIADIKQLMTINVTSYRNSKNSKLEDTWAGRRFSLNDSYDFDRYSIDCISEAEVYSALLMIGVELRLRKIFENAGSRILCSVLISGDEVLRSILSRCLRYEIKTEFKTGVMQLMRVFPCAMEGSSVLRLQQGANRIYEDYPSDLFVMLGLVFQKNYLPVGTYSVENSRMEVEEIPFEVSQGDWSFTLEIDYDSYRPYSDETFDEILYNVSLGLIRNLTHEHLEMIEDYINQHSNNPHALRKVIGAIVGCNFPRELDNEVLSILNNILKLIGTTLGDEILKSRFSMPQKFISRYFYSLISSLHNSVLFKLADNPELINLVDEYGIIQENTHRYILAEQIKRAKKNPKLNLTVRQLFNSLNSHSKELLLWILNEGSND